MPYEYAAENRLEHRHHYMYTPFEGPEFLRSYFEQRNQWIEDIQRLVSDEGLDATQNDDAHLAGGIEALLTSAPGSVDEGETCVLMGKDREVLPNGPRDCGFDTTALLVDLWREFASGSPSDTARAWLDLLVRKVEVSKRLYSSYGVDLKPQDKRFTDPEPYVLLAALAMLLYRREVNLKYLNLSLKLMDLISSLPCSACRLPQVAVATLDAEIEAVRQLMISQGVTT